MDGCLCQKSSSSSQTCTHRPTKHISHIRSFKFFNMINIYTSFHLQKEKRIFTCTAHPYPGLPPQLQPHLWQYKRPFRNLYLALSLTALVQRTSQVLKKTRPSKTKRIIMLESNMNPPSPIPCSRPQFPSLPKQKKKNSKCAKKEKRNSLTQK